MTPLIAGIFARYAGSSFATSNTGGLHLEVAPQGTAEPYTVYTVFGRPDYMLSEVHEIITVQFDIYALANAIRANLYGKLTALYDDCKPTATGYTTIIMERTNQQFLREGDQNQIFRAIVEYQAECYKAG